MNRWVSRCASLLATVLVVGAFGPSVQSASAAPLPAPYTARADSAVASVTTTLLGLPVVGLRVAQSADVVDSTATPRASSTSQNVGAAVAGLPISVAAGSQVAPPDNPSPSTGTLAGVNAGILSLGALTRSNQARWAGDTQCVPAGTLTATTTQTAGLSVGTLLGTGVSSSSNSTGLVAGSGPLNRAVQAQATGALAGISLLDGDVTVSISQSPLLTATASGSPGGAVVQRNNPIVTVTGPGGSTDLQLGAVATVTLDLGLAGEVTVTLNPPTSVVQSGDGRSASATWNFLRVQVQDGLGLASADTTLLPLQVAATAPAGGIDCPPAPPTIVVPAEGATTGPQPTYSGTAVANATVTVTVDGSVIGTTTADASGAWSLPQPTGLAEGSHQVTATQTVAGATSDPTPVRTFTVDLTAPAAPVVVTPADGSTTADSTPTYTGTAEPGSTVTVSVDGSVVGTTSADGSGNWSFTQPTALAAGDHAVNATATDAVGNVSPVSNTNTFTVDLTAPAAPVVVTPADGSTTTDSTPTYAGTAEAGSTVTVSVDGSVVGTTTADGSGNWSLTQPSALADGSHAVNATARDDAGNVSPVSNTNTFTVDATAPAAPVVVTPADGSTTADSTPAYTGTAEAGSTVTVSVDGSVVGTTTADGSGNWSLTQPTALAAGDHTVNATATDDAGNVSPVSNTNTFTVDVTAPAAPVVVTPADGSTTADSTPTYTGTAEPGSTVIVVVDATPIGTTTTDGSGNWSLTQPSALGDGSHAVNATARDDAGNVSPVSNTNTFTVDATAPAAPVVVTPADGSTIADSTPTYTGTAEAGSTVTVSVDGSAVGTTTADGSGAWSLTQPFSLAQGSHTVDATATDAAGNVSPVSNTNTFTVDLTAPLAPVVVTPADGSTTADPTPSYSGTAEAGSTVTVSVDGSVVGTTTADGTGNWSLIQPAALADGSHAVNATATDEAGNVSPMSNTNTFTVDATAPEAPAVVTPADGSTTNDPTPTYTGTAEAGSTVTVSADGSPIGTTTADGSGNWSLTQPTALAAGDHTVNATATDDAGNVSPVSNTNTFTVDVTAPAAPVVVTPADGSTTTDSTPSYSGTAEAGSTVTVSVDGSAVGTTTADGSGAWSLTQPTALGDGSHTVNATATDEAGNVSPVSNTNTFTVDATAPLAPVVVTPADGSTTADSTPTYTGTAEPGSTVIVVVDATPVGTTTADGSGNWSLTQPTALADGSHAVNATATDDAGNVSPVSNTNTFTVDATAPLAPVVVTPADGSTTADSTPTYTGTAEPGSTVIVVVDATPVGTTTADGSGAWSLTQPTALAAGSHTVNATATDDAGNVSPASDTNTFTVDTTAPAAPVVVTPADGSTTADSTPTYTGTAEPGSTVTVSVDGSVVGTTTADGTGSWSLTQPTALGDGSHTVNATATDDAGNVSPVSATNTFALDTTSGRPVVLAPADGSSTSDPTPVVSGTADPGATVTVRIDGTVVGTVTAGPDGAWTLTPTDPLSPGDHTVVATAVDELGNVSEDSLPVTFTVDTTAPEAPVITRPVDGSTTSDRTPVVAGTGEPGAALTVTIDGTDVGTTVVRPDGTWSLVPTTPLDDGPHVVVATQTDAAGLESPPSAPVTVIVDATPPPPPVIVSPGDGTTTTDSTPVVSGTGEPGSIVEVVVDGTPIGTTPVGPDGSWSLPVTEPLAPGDHVVVATQTDAVGNVSEASTARFTVAGAAAAPGGGSLARTGADVLPLLTLGLALVLAGVGSVLGSRRHAGLASRRQRH